MRDIEADYRRAYTEEYEGYRRAGLHERAARIATILRDAYGVEVDRAPDRAPERADSRPPENAAEPQPAQRRGPGRPRKNPPGAAR